MTYSGSSQPDLDWSQIRETVKLLAVTVAQVEGGMKVGDEAVDVLVNSFTSMVEDLSSIHEILSSMEQSPKSEEALKYCAAIQNRIQTSVVAFQFHDRLQQCLHHVSVGLRGLSDIIESPTRLYNPMEWYKFQEEIRGRYTMESEKIMFDAIHQGKSIDEAIALVEAANQQNNEDDDEVELF
nr:hypothetical protein [Methylomonas rhizoryzae]